MSAEELDSPEVPDVEVRFDPPAGAEPVEQVYEGRRVRIRPDVLHVVYWTGRYGRRWYVRLTGRVIRVTDGLPGRHARILAWYPKGEGSFRLFDYAEIDDAPDWIQNAVRQAHAGMTAAGWTP